MIKTFCFFLLKVDRQAQPWIFFTGHSHELITVKILEFYPAHFDLMVTNGLNKSPKMLKLSESCVLNWNKLSLKYQEGRIVSPVLI